MRNWNIMRISKWVLCIVCLTSVKLQAQENDSIKIAGASLQDTVVIDSIPKIDFTVKSENTYHFKPMQLIIPVTLVGIGIIGSENEWSKYRNRNIRDELQKYRNRKITIDNYSQYAPMVAVYGLNLCGIKGKHDFVERTIILATAYSIMGITVNGIKIAAKVERPDYSSHNSFPSGHTATAFMGAEFLRMEYKDVSPWIGVAGYAVATGTGFLRMYNNRHWLTDVLAGAGIGILSVRAAYWLYPAISNLLLRKHFRANAMITPYISSQEKGFCCQITF